ncbi:MAG: amidohydrolase [Nocardioidaceae bacterium]
MAAADLVFSGGAVYPATSDNQPPVTHVAVRSGRVAAVGGSEVLELSGPRTRRVDLGGGLLVPGFQDAHIHPVQGGRERLSCDLSGLDTQSAYVDAVRTYAQRTADRAWVTGGGWMLAAFPAGLPRREALDDVVPDRPAMLLNRDHHGAWVNSAALRLAGITAAAPDPADGRIERDQDGSPSGMLHEGAMDLVGSLVPEPTLAEQVDALLEAQAYLHSVGVTGWQDAILGSYANITDACEAYARCADDATLTATVVGALWWDRSRGSEQVPELVERRAQWTRTRFRPTSVKVMQDGIVENFTAGMLAPYLDAEGRTTSNAGLSMVEPRALRSYVSALDALGFQVHVHAIGDRAVREALDAFDAARRTNGPGSNRHHIAHLQVVHPDDIDRFAALGVAANLQPLWATHEDQMDNLTLPFLDADRAGWQYPFAALHASGATLAAGSDWPVTSPDPLAGIHVAVNRSLPPGAGEVREPFLPSQALDVETALRAYTTGSAFVNHRDDAGVIRVGAVADLAVLDRDILSGPPEAIGDASVVATYVDGVEVFTR